MIVIQPQVIGPTSLVSANTTAASGVQIAASGSNNYTNFWFTNQLAEPVAVGYGASAAAAQANAVLPTGNTSATASNCVVVANGSVGFRIPIPNPFFSIKSQSANGNVFITPVAG